MRGWRMLGAFAVAAWIAVAMGIREPAAAQACGFTINVPTATVGNLQQFFNATATIAAGCNTALTTTADWLTASGNRTTPESPFFLGITAAANTSGASRQASILLNGQTAVTVTQLTEPCVSGFDPASIRTDAAGAMRSTSLQTSAPDCVWMVMGFAAWVAFPNPLSGRGPATVTFGFMPNLSGPARSTDISFSGRSLHVEQDGPSCLFTVTPAEISMPANGGTGSFDVTGVGTDCVFSPKPSIEYVTITSAATATAPATVTFKVAPNVLPENTWGIQVQNTSFKIKQNGPPIRLDKFGASFAAALGPGGVRLSTGSSTIRITNAEQPNADFAAVADKPWATVTASSGQTPAEVTVGFDPAQVAQMASGFYTSTITFSSSIAPVSVTRLRADLRIYAAGETWTPFGVFETPRQNASMAGAIPVTGWALDAFGISKVSIYRDPVPGEPAGLVFIGDATRVRGARPDVINRTTAPDADRAGWGYMLLSNVLPGGGNGTFTLHAYADNTDGTRVLLGSRTVTFNNAAATIPFGTIDEPAQGATVSGTIVNRGWVLTPQTKTIPFDGSTIKVYIDGVLRAPVSSYTQARPDVKAFFPNYRNSDGPEARLAIDTTTLADGVHTIAWGVIDDDGAAEGIGSRYFTVQNGSASLIETPDTARAAATVARMPALTTEPWSRAGVDDLAWATRVETDASGKRTLRASRGQRIELFLDPTLRAACGTYTGHLLAGDVAGPLPAGASLDAERGIFRWQPVAETAGTFEFVFVQRGCDSIERRVSIAVRFE